MANDLETRLRDERDRLCARYDDGAIPPAVFAALKQIETDIAWLQHKGE